MQLPMEGAKGFPSPHPAAQWAVFPLSVFHSLVGNEASDTGPSLLLGDSKFWGVQELHWSQNVRWDLRRQEQKEPQHLPIPRVQALPNLTASFCIVGTNK